MAIGCYRDSDFLHGRFSDACRERASPARHAGVRQTSTEAAARSASSVHPLPLLGGTPPPATAMSHKTTLRIDLWFNKLPKLNSRKLAKSHT